MILTHSLLKLITVVLLTMLSSPTYAQWVAIEDEWDFSVQMPEFYSMTTDTVQMDADLMVIKTYTSQIDQNHFKLQATYYSSSYLQNNVETVLNTHPQSSATMVRGTLISSERKTLNGAPSIRYSIDSASKRHLFSLSVSNDTIYELQVSTPKDRELSPQLVDTFFDSFSFR